MALLQIYLAHVRQILTPPKGGGFGLFSTVDRLETRVVRAYVIGEGWERPVALEASSESLPGTLSLPTEAALRSIARPLLTRSYPWPIVGVRVEVWKRDFDSASLRARRVKLRELTLFKGGPGAD